MQDTKITLCVQDGLTVVVGVCFFYDQVMPSSFCFRKCPTTPRTLFRANNAYQVQIGEVYRRISYEVHAMHVAHSVGTWLYLCTLFIVTLFSQSLYARILFLLRPADNPRLSYHRYVMIALIGRCFIFVFFSFSLLLFPSISLQVDLVEQMGPLPFNLEFFTECQDMRELLAYLDAPPNMGRGGEDEQPVDDVPGWVREPQEDDGHESNVDNSAGGVKADTGQGEREEADNTVGNDDGGPRKRKRNERFRKLTEEICDVVDSYGLVSFFPLNIQVSLT